MLLWHTWDTDVESFHGGDGQGFRTTARETGFSLWEYPAPTWGMAVAPAPTWGIGGDPAPGGEPATHVGHRHCGTHLAAELRRAAQAHTITPAAALIEAGVPCARAVLLS